MLDIIDNIIIDTHLTKKEKLNFKENLYIYGYDKKPRHFRETNLYEMIDKIALQVYLSKKSYVEVKDNIKIRSTLKKSDNLDITEALYINGNKVNLD